MLEEAATSGHQFTGHEPDIPRQFTLERITGDAEFWSAALQKHTRALTASTVQDCAIFCNEKLCRFCV